ncbi:MAG: hypothetical protein HY318_13055 [Armatimonadetes bacterium]|nr:hypothetical protein [Armatimonadota bacterium]
MATPKFRYFLFPLVAMVSVALTGCFKASTVLQVNQDGTGKIIESVALRRDIIQQVILLLSGFAGAGPNKKAITEEDLLSTDQLAKKAGDYGSGVTFLTARRVQEGAYVRVIGEYAFRDVTKVRLKTSNDPGLMGQQAAPTQTPKKYISFGLIQSVSSRNSELIIKMPSLEPALSKPAKPKGESNAPGQMSKEQEQAMLELLKDMEVSVSIECGSVVTATNARYVEGNRITLVYLSFAKLLGQKDKLEHLKNLSPPPTRLEDVIVLLKGIEGIKLETQPEITVKYK